MRKKYLFPSLILSLITYTYSWKKESDPKVEVKKPWEGVEGTIKDYTTFDKERLAFGSGK